MLGSLALFTTATAETIIAENFGGAGTSTLNSTAADIFSPAITSAGGSATWAAAAGFKDNGSVTAAAYQCAYLTVGSYINASKGTAKGLFTLSATLTRSTTGSWGSIGFFRNPVTNEDFTRPTGNAMGLATLIYRTSGELDGFGGPGSLNNVDGPDAQSGPQLLTVVLDLTGHNNSTNFGSVSFYQGTADPGNLLGTYNYTADYSFDAIGLSQASYNGTFSGLQLEQGVAGAATTMGLIITPSAMVPGSYDFEWDSRTGQLYDLLSSPDLATPPAEWALWDPDGEGGSPPYGNLVPAAGRTRLEDVPGGNDARRFFVVAEKEPLPPTTSHLISTSHYDVRITDPGFRMEVSTADGVALPADPTAGLLFSGHAAVSSEEIHRADGLARFRVTNANGQTALAEVKTGAHAIEVTITHENGQPGRISMRTASPGPAYGLGDSGGWQSNANLSSTQKSYSIYNNGSTHRWLSSFLIFPASGSAGACFERKGGEIGIGPNTYSMSNRSAISQKFHYFVGSMDEIYAAWRDVRIAEGYPGVVPKMDGFELGFETWDLLRWNTNAATCQGAIQQFLDNGYRVRWAVTGSGFWQSQGTTVSFGLYDFTKYPETSAPLPPDFGDWCKARGIRWMIGQRTNFVPPGGPFSSNPGESGATVFDTSPDSQAGIDLGYFLKDASGNHVLVKSGIFPTVHCLMLDGNVPGAGAWFKERYDAWGVDGVKEDTMMALPDHTIFNAPMRAIAEGGDLVMARCGAYTSPGTLTRVNDTGGASSMTLRCPINYLQYAASAAPNVYSDTVGFGNMSNFTATMRHAWLLSLTAGMAVSDSPWNRNWSAAGKAQLKKVIDFHYQIGPYLHSCAVDSHTTGYPHTMTPLPIAFPNDPATYDLASAEKRQFQWIIGPSLLAAPLLHANYSTSTLMNIYLPAGKWIDIENGTVHTGPTTLTDYDMPLDKIPVFVGGKGVYVSRIDDVSPLQAVVFPIATGGSSYTFTHPDGTSKSTIVNANTGWNKATLTVTDTTTGSPTKFTIDSTTGAIRFDLLPGHSYRLGGGA